MSIPNQSMIGNACIQYGSISKGKKKEKKKEKGSNNGMGTHRLRRNSKITWQKILTEMIKTYS